MNSKKLIKTLKNKYWNNGIFYDTKSKRDKAVCFHSRDIRKHDSCFNDSVINYNEFTVDLSDTMKDIKCKIIDTKFEGWVRELAKIKNEDDYKQKIFDAYFDIFSKEYNYHRFPFFDAKSMLGTKLLIEENNEKL